MSALAIISGWEAIGIVAGFVLALAWNILRGRIHLRGLLSGDRASGETYFSWGRVQFLAVVLYIAGRYLFDVYRDSNKFPEVPIVWIAILGISAALYTAEKAWAMRLGQAGNSMRRTP